MERIISTFIGTLIGCLIGNILFNHIYYRNEYKKIKNAVEEYIDKTYPDSKHVFYSIKIYKKDK